MAKTYRFYNDAKTIDVTYITDAMLNHEVFTVTEIQGLDSAEIQMQMDFGILPNTEKAFKAFATTNLLNLHISNDTTQVSDVKGGNDIISLEFTDVTETTNVVDATAHTVAIAVPNGTTVTALVANFVLSSGASAAIGATAQVTGVTANNFTSPKTYIITSGAGVAQNWTVTVTVL